MAGGRGRDWLWVVGTAIVVVPAAYAASAAWWDSGFFVAVLVCGAGAVWLGGVARRSTARGAGRVLLWLSIAAVTIAGLLAAWIPVAQLSSYNIKAKTTEAKVVLGGIVSSQYTFHEQFGGFVPARATPTGAPASVKRPWESDPCPPACGPTSTSACSGYSCIGYEPAGHLYYQYECTVAADGQDFACGAIGDLDGDDEFGVFVYRGSFDRKTQRSNAPLPGIVRDHCPDEVPMGDVYSCRPGVY